MAYFISLYGSCWTYKPKLCTSIFVRNQWNPCFRRGRGWDESWRSMEGVVVVAGVLGLAWGGLEVASQGTAYIDGGIPYRIPRRWHSRETSSWTAELTVLGLFELSCGADVDAGGAGGAESPLGVGGGAELAGALLAVKHVNRRRLLGHIRLSFVSNDTKVTPFRLYQIRFRYL